MIIIIYSNLLTTIISPGFDPHNPLVAVIIILITIPIIPTHITQITIMETITITTKTITMVMIKEVGQGLMEVIMETVGIYIY